MFDIPCRPLQKQALVRRLPRQEGNKKGRTGRVEGIVIGVVELEVEGLIENQIDVVDLSGDLERALSQRLLLKAMMGISRVLIRLEFAEWFLLRKACMYCTVQTKKISRTG